MKTKAKIILSVSLFAIMSKSQGQNTFPATGKVGIGTTAPIRSLHVNGELSLSSTNGACYINVSNVTGNGGGSLYIRGLDQNGSVTASTNVTVYGSLTLSGNQIINYNQTIKGNQTVNGVILTSKVKVAVPGGANWNFAFNNKTANWQWADYVFDKGYKLPSLAEVEKYIEQYKHLANIPSADEVKKDGIDLGEMNAKLLAKIEELTLYLIEINKKIDDQNKRMELLEKENAEQKTKIEMAQQ